MIRVVGIIKVNRLACRARSRTGTLKWKHFIRRITSSELSCTVITIMALTVLYYGAQIQILPASLEPNKRVHGSGHGRHCPFVFVLCYCMFQLKSELEFRNGWTRIAAEGGTVQYLERTDFKVLCLAFRGPSFAPLGNVILLQQGLDRFVVPLMALTPPLPNPKLRFPIAGLPHLSFIDRLRALHLIRSAGSYYSRNTGHRTTCLRFAGIIMRQINCLLDVISKPFPRRCSLKLAFYVTI